MRLPSGDQAGFMALLTLATGAVPSSYSCETTPSRSPVRMPSVAVQVLVSADAAGATAVAVPAARAVTAASATSLRRAEDLRYDKDVPPQVCGALPDCG